PPPRRSPQDVTGSDPACVHVDCAGPVREDVPSDGFLGEGLTGENDRLKRGLKSGTPAGPLRGLGSRGGEQVASLGAISRLVLLGEAPHGVTRRAIRAGVPTLADYLGAFCPGELVDPLAHVVRLGES